MSAPEYPYPPGKITTKQAVEFIAGVVYPDDDKIAARKRVREKIRYARQKKLLPAADIFEPDKFFRWAIAADEKDAMRDLVLRSGPWNDAEQRAILDYCESDVLALAKLLPAMQPHIDWQVFVGNEPNPRSLCNFPMQANGAEMLRLACIRLVADGVRICAPVHDAILIEAPLAELDEAVAHTQAVMRAASAAVLGGFMLESDAKIVRYPERYMDERGTAMWNTVMGLIGLETRKVGAGATATCPPVGHLPVPATDTRTVLSLSDKEYEYA